MTCCISLSKCFSVDMALKKIPYLCSIWILSNIKHLGFGIHLCTISFISTNIPPNILAGQDRNLPVTGAGTESSTEARCTTVVHGDAVQALANRTSDALFFVFNLLPTFLFFIKRLTKTLCLARSLSSIANQYYTPSNSLSVQVNLLDIGWSHLIYHYVQGSPFPTLSVPLSFLFVCLFLHLPMVLISMI